MSILFLGIKLILIFIDKILHFIIDIVTNIIISTNYSIKFSIFTGVNLLILFLCV